MADAQDLHQIEYRHHQTKDLSPAASSMTSRESLAAWDSRIRAWVRHPHADLLAESTCYQVFANGQAALAWRYWDERAASRHDGTRGRPLVSRVIVGPESALTAAVALAACRTGPSSDWVGPLPGQVADAGELPTVRGEALLALAREMTAELDRASAAQQGLQAVVAAALAEPSAPLAISVPDALIQLPLRDSVQCPLLWGLHRITSPLLGSVGRGWSFSTFELPLGEMDPKSLPAIVFREVQGGVKAPPSRWRREAKVRPFEAGALDAGTSYAGMVELAGWLVAEYQERGGDGLAQFMADNGGGAGSLPLRMDKVSDALRKAHQPRGLSGHRRLAGMLGGRSAAPSPEREAPGPAEPPLVAAGLADPAALNARTWDPWAPSFPASEPPEAESLGPGPGVGRGTRPGESGDPPAAVPPYPAGQAGPRAAENAPAAGLFEAPPVQEPAATAAWPVDAELAGPQPAPPYSEPPYSEPRYSASASPPAVEGGHATRPAWHPPNADALAPSREGQAPPPLRLPDRGGLPVDMPPPARERNPWRAGQEPVSALLRKLELLGEDQQRFESILDEIYVAGAITPEERGKSWDVISSSGWHETICRNNAFRSGDLVRIFSIVVVPVLVQQPPAEAIARWAQEAPVPMVECLLAAAKAADTGIWHTVMGILEPALAYRWTTERFIRDYWDDDRAVRFNADLGRGDGKGGIFGLRRRPGRR